MYIRLLLLISLMLLSTIAFAERLLDAMPRTMVAQNFKLPYSTSGEFSLDEYKGHFTIVSFWSTKCAACRADLSFLEDLKSQLAEQDIKLNVVAVHAGDDVDGVNEQIEISPVSYAMVMDMDLELGHWGIPTLPTTYVLTPDGNFAYRALGSRLWNSPQMIDFLKRVFEDYEQNKVTDS